MIVSHVDPDDADGVGRRNDGLNIDNVELQGIFQSIVVRVGSLEKGGGGQERQKNGMCFSDFSSLSKLVLSGCVTGVWKSRSC
jgi:hypothetical protein